MTVRHGAIATLILVIAGWIVLFAGIMKMGSGDASGSGPLILSGLLGSYAVLVAFLVMASATSEKGAAKGPAVCAALTVFGIAMLVLNALLEQSGRAPRMVVLLAAWGGIVAYIAVEVGLISVARNHPAETVRKTAGTLSVAYPLVTILGVVAMLVFAIGSLA